MSLFKIDALFGNPTIIPLSTLILENIVNAKNTTFGRMSLFKIDALFRNLSIKDGVFPDLLKTSKVNPIFKKGDPSLVSNYRPISLIPIFSKIFERVIYNRIYNYMTTNNLFYKKQFGFQKNCSTEHAILELVEQITKSFDNNNYMLGVFIDLSKAFDTVNHEILLNKFMPTMESED